MRLMQIVRFPHEKFNETVRDGSAGQKTDAILEEIKPARSYIRIGLDLSASAVR